MLIVYINYPVGKVSAHRAAGCAHVGKGHKVSQRRVRVTVETLSEELVKFRMGGYRFASNARENDMWIELDCQDDRFEKDVLAFLCRVLGNRYKRFRGISVRHHGCKA